MTTSISRPSGRQEHATKEAIKPVIKVRLDVCREQGLDDAFGRCPINF